jgi:hypothetical protein
MSTFKQEPENVREKIRQLENRQKILLNRKADAECITAVALEIARVYASMSKVDWIVVCNQTYRKRGISI